jgi:hypothetical protein
MAIKLSGSVSRKVPIQGVQFSSQSYSAGMEIEINSADANEVRAQLAQLYLSLNQGIDAQIAAVGQQPEHAPQTPVVNTASARSQPVPVQSTPPPMQQRPAYANGNGRSRIAAVTNGNGNGNGRRSVNATEAQCRAIFAICKAQGIDMAAALADFNVADARDLHVKDASRLIDDLKSKQAANGAGH